jgi:hypothetical protein
MTGMSSSVKMHWLIDRVDRIPMTTWYRPNPAALRDEGVPDADALTWRYDSASRAYLAG